jgi:peptidoglycan L-alanyl-D-glutamate endopeptidase CwlK
MMPSYSLRSRRNLDSADPRLAEVFDEVIKHFDCSVICGHRDQVQQEAAYHSGNSKVTWPNSMHNRSPSRAVDVLPYPIDWNDREGMAHLAGFVIATGKSKGLNIKWGGDWAQDRKSSDTNFFDGGHYEIVDA